MVKLSRRLQAIFDLVPPVEVVADIGTDHALLPITLVQRGVSLRAIASDLKPGPLERAREQVQKAGLVAQIDLRLGEGLSPLAPGEAGAIILAGMGGYTIIDVLNGGGSVLKYRPSLILQPNGREREVRQWLAMSGWQIVAERLVKEGAHFYQVLQATRGSMALSPAEAELGPVILKENPPLLKAYLAQRLRLYQRNLSGLACSREPDYRRIKELENLVTELKEVSRWL